MRRGLFVAITFASLTTIASAQDPRPRVSPVPMAANGPISSAEVERILVRAGLDVVGRLMSFDRNGDGKIARSELPERMQPVVTQADDNGDGALDAIEIRALARKPSPAATVRGFGHPGGYAFGDQIGVSTRAHVEGAIEDLRLDTATRERALAVASDFLDARESAANDRLLSELAGVLASDQLADVRTALERSGSNRIGIVPLAPPNDSKLRLVLPVGRPLELDELTQAQRSKAIEAITRFRAFRMDDGERATLVAGMKDILTDQERDDFKAALERRPLMKSGVVAGVVGGMTKPDVVMENRGIVRPAILVAPPVTLR
jgi:EF hand domain-containing protein